MPGPALGSHKSQAVLQAWKREAGKLPSRKGTGGAGGQQQMPLAFQPSWARCLLTSSWLLPSTTGPLLLRALNPLYSEAVAVRQVFAKQQQSFLTRASCLQELLLNDIVTSTVWHKFQGCFPRLAAYLSSSSAFLRCGGRAMGFQQRHESSHDKRNELSSVLVRLAISV